MKLLLLALAVTVVYADLPPPCSRPVFCDSKLLHYVQMSRIFSDSKSFLDLQLKNDENVVLSEFDLLLQKSRDHPSDEQLQDFINDHFTFASDLEKWTPSDFSKRPSFLQSVRDPKLRQFGEEINAIWPVLGRKVSPVVFEKPEYFSIVPVSNGFIVPGGNLKELYYWDTYWIVEGLLVSGMKETAKGMISNLIELQRKFGYVPYGNRYYYQDRSEPPLLSAMMALYMQETKDVEFLKANIDALEGELEYWLNSQAVVFPYNGKEYALLRYFSVSKGPRPEFYYEDYNQAKAFDSSEAREQFYIDVKSASESGWAFSSRWFINKDGSNSGNYAQIRTSSIIPVDLNAIFANAMQNVASFYSLLRNQQKSQYWSNLANEWKYNIQNVLWNEEDGIWYDYDLENAVSRKYFYVSNIAPLWMDIVDKEFIREKGVKIVQYLKKTQSLQYPGGVPASVIRSGEQWDFPNAWPPLVSMMVSALESLQTEESAQLAFQVAQNWVRSMYQGFGTNKQMFEKYDVESPGKVGAGGYSAQPGYGWSNGVVLELLAKYGQTLTAQDSQYYNSYFNIPYYNKAPFTYYKKPVTSQVPSYTQQTVSQPSYFSSFPQYQVNQKVPVPPFQAPVTEKEQKFPLPTYTSDLSNQKVPSFQYDVTQKAPLSVSITESVTQKAPVPFYSQYNVPQKTQHSVSVQESVTQKAPLPTYTSEPSIQNNPLPTTSEYEVTQKVPLPTYSSNPTTQNEPLPTYSQYQVTQKVPVSLSTQESVTQKFPQSPYNLESVTQKVPLTTYSPEPVTQKAPLPTYSQFEATPKVPLPEYTSEPVTQKVPLPTYTSEPNVPKNPFPGYSQYQFNQKSPLPTYLKEPSTQKFPFSSYSQYKVTEKVPTPPYFSSSVTEKAPLPLSNKDSATQTSSLPFYNSEPVTQKEHVSEYVKDSVKEKESVTDSTKEPFTLQDSLSYDAPKVSTSANFPYSVTQKVPILTQEPVSQTDTVPTTLRPSQSASVVTHAVDSDAHKESLPEHAQESVTQKIPPSDYQTTSNPSSVSQKVSYFQPQKALVPGKDSFGFKQFVGGNQKAPFSTYSQFPTTPQTGFPSNYYNQNLLSYRYSQPSYGQPPWGGQQYWGAQKPWGSNYFQSPAVAPKLTFSSLTASTVAADKFPTPAVKSSVSTPFAGSVSGVDKFSGSTLTGSVSGADKFSGSTLTGSVTGADKFSSPKLTGSVSGVDKFSGSTLTGSVSLTDNFSGSTLTGSVSSADKFSGSGSTGSVSGVDKFSSSALTGSVSGADKFSVFPLTGSVSGADKFSGSSLTGYVSGADKLSGSALTGSVSGAKKFSGSAFAGFGPGADKFSGASLTGSVPGADKFSGSKLTGSVSGSDKFSGSAFTGSVSGALTGSVSGADKFSGSKLTGSVSGADKFSGSAFTGSVSGALTGSVSGEAKVPTSGYRPFRSFF